MNRNLAVGLGSLLLVACAHSTEQMHATSSHEVSPAQAEREVLAVDQPAPETAAARSRPRLSQTITLGQNNNDATYVGPTPPPSQGSPGGGNNVVINNNVVVNNQPPAIYGGYGYGYRGYSSGFGRDGFNRGSSSGTPSQWGTNGWEGARRTAAPGQTPNIGGNWPTVPSYGPAPMR